MRKVCVLLCLAVLVSTRAGAELKYTVKTEVQKPEGQKPEAQKTEAPKADGQKAQTPAGKAPNPMLAMMGDALSRQLLPEGSATMTYLIGEKGTRIDFVNAAMGQAAGTVTIIQPDGSTIVLNPKDQTYWKSTMQGMASAMQSAGLTPQVTSTRTGEIETVAGVKCERSTFTMKMDLPIPPAARASLGADFPSSLDMAGDTCLTSEFQNYAEMAAKTQATGMLAAMGIDKLPQGGIVLRQSVRVGGVELRSAVTEIAEVPAPEGAFEIPAGYKEAQPPATPR
jgi:Domain of unknown function (DUF4412)